MPEKVSVKILRKVFETLQTRYGKDKRFSLIGHGLWQVAPLALSGRQVILAFCQRGKIARLKIIPDLDSHAQTTLANRLVEEKAFFEARLRGGGAKNAASELALMFAEPAYAWDDPALQLICEIIQELKKVSVKDIAEEAATV